MIVIMMKIMWICLLVVQIPFLSMIDVVWNDDDDDDDEKDNHNHDHDEDEDNAELFTCSADPPSSA